MKNYPTMVGVAAGFGCLLFLLFACEGSLNERIKKATGTIHKAQTTATEISKTANELSKKVDAYADTMLYNKDSTGIWQKKQVAH
jgi:hypothetical protein